MENLGHWFNIPVLVTSLERINNPQDLSSVPSSGSWVRQDKTDGLLGVNNEDGSDGEGDSLGVDIGGVLVV